MYVTVDIGTVFNVPHFIKNNLLTRIYSDVTGLTIDGVWNGNTIYQTLYTMTKFQFPVTHILVLPVAPHCRCSIAAFRLPMAGIPFSPGFRTLPVPQLQKLQQLRCYTHFTNHYSTATLAEDSRLIHIAAISHIMQHGPLSNHHIALSSPCHERRFFLKPLLSNGCRIFARLAIVA
jgi:hypothetical protein